MLTHVTIVVKNQNEALEFYTKKMGFEKKADYQNPGQPRWLTVAPKGQAIEMVLWQAGMGSDPNLPASHKQPGIGTHWVLEVDDVRKTFAELKARGVKFKDGSLAKRAGASQRTSSIRTAAISRLMRHASPPRSRTGLRRARRHRTNCQASSWSGLDAAARCTHLPRS